ncbi:hypothetical protein [Polaribacter sp. P097]
MMSFTSSSKSNSVIKLELPEVNVDQNGWGTWKTTDCFRGLDFRVKRKKK